jgi:hypothetical protein
MEISNHANSKHSPLVTAEDKVMFSLRLKRVPKKLFKNLMDPLKTVSKSRFSSTPRKMTERIKEKAGIPTFLLDICQWVSKTINSKKFSRSMVISNLAP